ncbi:hypothetical protein, partial [Streptomyces sp. Agncl-13]|uniref:hypothetical protein n=1 Tax=Streptomyces sp. Agncl-13 TaxID=3400628 RepID=UPI003A8720F4
LQVVQGITPTMSGVHMLPMVFGMLISSTARHDLPRQLEDRPKRLTLVRTGVAGQPLSSNAGRAG